MPSFKTTLLSTALLSLFCSPVFAVDNAKDIDASDLTRANSTLIFQGSNDGDLKASGSISFNHANGQSSMVTLEGTMDKEGDYKDSRLQLFQVFNLDSKVSPRIAASLDFIDNKQLSTAALGAISIFKTPMDSLTFYGRAAVMGGQYSDSTTDAFNVSDNSIIGGMGAIYGVWQTGEDGTYLAVYPEYNYLDGDITTETLKTTFQIATPLSQNKKHWGQIKVENTHGSMSSASINQDINDTVVWFVYKAFL